MVAQYKPVLHVKAERELNELDESDRSRLTSLIHDVCSEREPTQHSRARHLEGQEDLFRLREGDVRAICALDKPELKVICVGKRDSVYENIDDVDQRLETPA